MQQQTTIHPLEGEDPGLPSVLYMHAYYIQHRHICMYTNGHMRGRPGGGQRERKI